MGIHHLDKGSDGPQRVAALFHGGTRLIPLHDLHRVNGDQKELQARVEHHRFEVWMSRKSDFMSGPLQAHGQANQRLHVASGSHRQYYNLHLALFLDIIKLPSLCVMANAANQGPTDGEAPLSCQVQFRLNTRGTAQV